MKFCDGGSASVGLCQHPSHCDDNTRTNQLCNTMADLLPNIYSPVKEKCAVKCCQHDLCNTPFQPALPVQDLPFQFPTNHNQASDASDKCDLLDVALIVDSSSSIGRRSFNQLRRFLKRLIWKLRVGIDKTRVAAIRFSEHVTPLWHFVDSFNAFELDEIIDIMEFTGGKKRMTNLFHRVSSDVFSKFRGNRPNVPDVVVIFTDGQSRERPSLRVRWLKRMKIRIMTVAVGDRLNMNQLYRIASRPKVSNVFNISNFDGVRDALRNASDCFRGTRCYFGPNVTGVIKNNFQMVKRCENNFVCLDVKATIHSPFPFPGAISFGNCVPQSNCSSYNCSHGLAFIPSLYSGAIRNCTTRCCSDDLCNLP